MIYITAILLFLIFLFLSVIHVYWGFGGKWGSESAIPKAPGGERVLNPGLTACLVVAFALLAVGVFILHQAGFFAMNLPAWLNQYGLYFLGIIFMLRAIGDFRYVGFFKTIRGTEFARMDTRYYSPLCVLIFLLLIVLQRYQ